MGLIDTAFKLHDPVSTTLLGNKKAATLHDPLTAGYVRSKTEKGEQGAIGNAADYFQSYIRGFMGSDKQSPWTRGEVVVRNGKVDIRGLGDGGKFQALDFGRGDDYGRQVGEGITQYAADLATSYLEENELLGQKGVNFKFRVGGASGRSANLGTGLFVGGRGDFRTGADVTNIQTMQTFDEEVMNVLRSSTEGLIKKKGPKEKPKVYEESPVQGTEEKRMEAMKQAATAFKQRDSRQSTILTGKGGGALPSVKRQPTTVQKVLR